MPSVPSISDGLMITVADQDPRNLRRLMNGIVEEYEGRHGLYDEQVTYLLDDITALCWRTGKVPTLEIYYGSHANGAPLHHAIQRIVAWLELKSEIAGLDTAPLGSFQFFADGKPSSINPSLSAERQDAIRYSMQQQQTYSIDRIGPSVTKAHVIQVDAKHYTLMSAALFMQAFNRWLLPLTVVKRSLVALRVNLENGLCGIEVVLEGEEQAPFYRKVLPLVAIYSYLSHEVVSTFVILPHLPSLSKPTWALAIGGRLDSHAVDLIAHVRSIRHLQLFVSPSSLIHRPYGIIKSQVGYSSSVLQTITFSLTKIEPIWERLVDLVLSGKTPVGMLGFVVRPFKAVIFDLDILLGPTDDPAKLIKIIEEDIVQIPKTAHTDCLLCGQLYLIQGCRNAPQLLVLGNRGGIAMAEARATRSTIDALEPIEFSRLIATTAPDHSRITMAYGSLTIGALQGIDGFLALCQSWGASMPGDVALRVSLEGVQIVTLSPETMVEVESLVSILRQSKVLQRLSQLLPVPLEGRFLLGKNDSTLTGSIQIGLNMKMYGHLQLKPVKMAYKLKGRNSRCLIADLTMLAETYLLHPERVISLTVLFAGGDYDAAIMVDAASQGFKSVVDRFMGLVLAYSNAKHGENGFILADFSGEIIPSEALVNDFEVKSEQFTSPITLIPPYTFPQSGRKWVYYRQSVSGDQYEKIEDASVLLDRPFLGSIHPIFKDYDDILLLLDLDAIERFPSDQRLHVYRIDIRNDLSQQLESLSKTLMKCELSVVGLKQTSINEVIELEIWMLKDDQESLMALIGQNLIAGETVGLPKLVDCPTSAERFPLKDWRIFHQNISTGQFTVLPFLLEDCHSFLYEVMVYKALLPGFQMVASLELPSLYPFIEYPAIEIDCSEFNVATHYFIALVSYISYVFSNI